MKMEKPEKFSDYSFSKMSPPSSPTDVEVEESKIKKFFVKNLLLFVTVFGVIFGIVLGLCLKPLNLSPDVILLIAYPGELFMRLLKLMILPLIVASLIAGSASLNAKMNGKIAIRTLTYFILTSFFNATLGVCLAVLMQPGDPNLERNVEEEFVDNNRNINIFDSLLDLGRNIFPDNLFQAAFQQTHTVYVTPEQKIKNSTFNISEFDSLSNIYEKPVEMVRQLQYRSGVNTLGIVFFCLVFGTVLGTIGSKGQIVIDFFTAVFEVIMKMVTGVMWSTPIGISSVIAGKILGMDNLALVMSQVGWFIAVIAIGVFFYQFVILQLIYYIIIKKNPFKFYWGLIQATLTASATASTAAALPVTFRCMNDKLKVDPRITRFVLPIGCNINMDGTALFLAVSSIFIAQMNNIQLGFGELCTVLLTSTACSLSSASVPSAALVLLLIVLSSINVPTHDVTLLFAIDWFVDRIRTTNNMLGDCYAAAVVEHLSKSELSVCNPDVYYQEPATIKTNLLNNGSDVESGYMESKVASSPASDF